MLPCDNRVVWEWDSPGGQSCQDLFMKSRMPIHSSGKLCICDSEQLWKWETPVSEEGGEIPTKLLLDLFVNMTWQVDMIMWPMHDDQLVVPMVTRQFIKNSGKIEESETASSCRELNPGHYWPLSHDNRTTTNPHNPLHVLHVVLKASVAHLTATQNMPLEHNLLWVRACNPNRSLSW